MVTTREVNMTVEEAYRGLKGNMATKDDFKDMMTKSALKAETAKTRTWIISLFIGAVIIISTLVGVYANMTIALLK